MSGRTMATAAGDAAPAPEVLGGAPVTAPPPRDGATPPAAFATFAEPVPRGARVLVGATAAMLVAGVVGQVAGLSESPLVVYRDNNFYALAAFAAPVLGWLVVRRAPGNAVGWLLLVTGAAAATAFLALSTSEILVGAWLGQWVPWLTLGLLPLPLLVFPDGVLPSRGWRWLWRAGIATVVVPAVLFAAGAVAAPWDLVSVDTQAPTGALALARAAVIVGGIGLVSTAIGGLCAVLLRWVRTEGRTRGQLRVLGMGALLIPPLLVAEFEYDAGTLGLAALALPVAMTVAILRHRLLDLDTLINRSLVYGVLSVVVVGVYVGVVTGLGVVLGDTWSWGPSLVATALVAVAFEPLRERMQRAANRLLYGDRDDPYRVVSRLGEQLEHVVDVDAVLPGVVATVEQSLQVPYVAVVLTGPDGDVVVADNGREPVDVTPVSYPMTYLDEEVGRLLVAPRSGTRPFTAAEEALLRSLARQAGVAARTVRLFADLRRSRDRIVRSREEERRRLRRDLHDGLGPRLAGLRMQVGAGQVALSRGTLPPALLAGVEEELRTCVAEVRRVIDDLRPPALDEVGLVGALERHASAVATPSLSVAVEASGDLDRLPAAVEVAAYRIVAEAVTNVVKHAGAARCVVAVHRDERALRLAVTDDGVGFSGPRPDGVGLGSMRERAEELGGELWLDDAERGGTVVHAVLPLRGAGVVTA